MITLNEARQQLNHFRNKQEEFIDYRKSIFLRIKVF